VSVIYLEDLAVGQKFGSGRVRVEAAAIKAFAAEFDPRPFHLDEEAAKDSFFQGLAASGWHTAALSARGPPLEIASSPRLGQDALDDFQSERRISAGVGGESDCAPADEPGRPSSVASDRLCMISKARKIPAEQQKAHDAETAPNRTAGSGRCGGSCGRRGRRRPRRHSTSPILPAGRSPR